MRRQAMRNGFIFEAEPLNLEWLGEGGSTRTPSDKEYDDLVREIKKELVRPFQSPNDPGLQVRRQRLRQLFSQIPSTHTKRLHSLLGQTPGNDELSKIFHYRLSTPERRELLEILKRNFPVTVAPPTPVAPPPVQQKVLVWGTRPLPASENARFFSAFQKLQKLVSASGDPRSWRYWCWFNKLLMGGDDRLVRWSTICPRKSGAIGAAYVVGPCDLTLGSPVRQEDIQNGIK